MKKDDFDFWEENETDTNISFEELLIILEFIIIIILILGGYYL